MPWVGYNYAAPLGWLPRPDFHRLDHCLYRLHNTTVPLNSAATALLGEAAADSHSTFMSSKYDRIWRPRFKRCMRRRSISEGGACLTVAA
jgi:hypothetical protein